MYFNVNSIVIVIIIKKIVISKSRCDQSKVLRGGPLRHECFNTSRQKTQNACFRRVLWIFVTFTLKSTGGGGRALPDENSLHMIFEFFFLNRHGRLIRPGKTRAFAVYDLHPTTERVADFTSGGYGNRTTELRVYTHTLLLCYRYRGTTVGAHVFTTSVLCFMYDFSSRPRAYVPSVTRRVGATSDDFTNLGFEGRTTQTNYTYVKRV